MCRFVTIYRLMFHQMFRWVHQGYGRPEGAQFAVIAGFSVLLMLNLVGLCDWLSVLAPQSEFLQAAKLATAFSIIILLPLHLFVCVRGGMDLRIAQSYQCLSAPSRRNVALLTVFYVLATMACFYSAPTIHEGGEQEAATQETTPQ